MKSKIIQFVNLLLNLGTTPEQDIETQLDIRHINLGGGIAFLLALITTTSTSKFLPYPYIYIPFIFSFLFLLVFYFNYIQWYETANATPWTIAIILFFWMANAYGENSNAYLLFIAAEMMAVLNFNTKRKWIYLTSSIPIILSIITYYSDFSLFLIPNLKSESLHALHVILYFAVLISSLTAIWVHRTQVQQKVGLLEEQKRLVETSNKELKKTNEELDRFVYSVSHDLRAPITSVLGLIELMKTDAENIGKYMDLQEKSMHRLDSFIQDILHYARNSRLEIIPKNIHLVNFIQDIYHNQVFALSGEKLKLDLVEKNELNIPFYSDEFRIGIVFNNLISNAIRYRNPKVDSFLSIHCNILLEKAIITIKDNGIGIPAEHLPNIFQMFYRANSKYVGSGLGLYIVKEALNKMNGTIEVSSEEGKGSVFTITIPNLT